MPLTPPKSDAPADVAAAGDAAPPAPDPVTFTVGQVVRTAAGGDLALVVAVAPAEGDAAAIYDTVALPPSVTRYYAADLETV